MKFRASVGSGPALIKAIEKIKETVLRLLWEIAPKAGLTKLRPEVSCLDQLDIDSMDFLTFVIAPSA